MSQWIELKLDDSPAPVTSSLRPKYTTEALDDVEGVRKRNEEAVRLVTGKIEKLREHSARVLQGECVAGSQSSGSLVAKAFRARLETQSKVMKSSGLRGAPAACVDRVVSSLSQGIEVLESVASEFPLIVRKASGATMTELKTSHAKTSEQIHQAGVEVEKYTESYTSRTDTRHGQELISVSLEKIATVREDLVSSRVFRDLCDAARYTMDNFSHEDLLFAAGAILSHVETLKRCPAEPEIVEKEVQCIELAFEEWRRELERQDSGHRVPSQPSSSVPPKSLMNQIEDESRRRELETMPAPKAIQLLRHTRSAMSRVDPDSSEHKKLTIIAKILSFRAGGEQISGEQVDTSGLIETWRLQKSLVLNLLHRLKSAAQIVTKIQSSIRGDLDSTLQRIKDVHMKTVNTLKQQAATHDKGVMDRYVFTLNKAFSSSVVKIMSRATSLSEAVVAALEMFISTGLLMQTSDEGLGQEFKSTAEWMEAKSDLAPLSEIVEETDFAPAPALLRKVYALTIDAFEAWVDYAMALLTTNANGMHRAMDAVRKAGLT